MPTAMAAAAPIRFVAFRPMAARAPRAMTTRLAYLHGRARCGDAVTTIAVRTRDPARDVHGRGAGRHEPVDDVGRMGPCQGADPDRGAEGERRGGRLVDEEAAAASARSGERDDPERPQRHDGVDDAPQPAEQRLQPREQRGQCVVGTGRPRRRQREQTQGDDRADQQEDVRRSTQAGGAGRGRPDPDERAATAEAAHSPAGPFRSDRHRASWAQRRGGSRRLPRGGGVQTCGERTAALTSRFVIRTGTCRRYVRPRQGDPARVPASAPARARRPGTARSPARGCAWSGRRRAAAGGCASPSPAPTPRGRSRAAAARRRRRPHR